MEAPRLSSLQGFTEIGLRGGVDMRPTLLRVLTDLYVQKLTHTPEEDLHYTELALRLLEFVDVPTRVAVATRLARHLSPPAPVIKSWPPTCRMSRRRCVRLGRHRRAMPWPKANRWPSLLPLANRPTTARS